MKKFLLIVFASMLSPSLGLAVMVAVLIGNTIERRKRNKAYKAEQIQRYMAEQEKARRAQAIAEEKERRDLAKRQAQFDAKASVLEGKVGQAVETIAYYKPIVKSLGWDRSIAVKNGADTSALDAKLYKANMKLIRAYKAVDDYEKLTGIVVKVPMNKYA